MNARAARQLLRAYRPSGEDDDERDVAAALKVAAKTPELESSFRNQLAFDRAIAAKLETALPDDLATSLEEVARRLEKKPGRKFSLRDPAILAVGLAFVMLVGLIGWMVMGSVASVQQAVEIAQAGDKAGPDQFKEVDMPAGALTDWFVVQEFEGFSVPHGLESAPAIGARVFKYDDLPVAVAAIGKPKSLWYAFDANSFGVSIHPGEWKIVDYGQLSARRAVAVTRLGDMAFMIVLRGGGRAELQKYIDSLPHAP
jgi:hypothetical protein